MHSGNEKKQKATK